MDYVPDTRVPADHTTGDAHFMFMQDSNAPILFCPHLQPRYHGQASPAKADEAVGAYSMNVEAGTNPEGDCPNAPSLNQKKKEPHVFATNSLDSETRYLSRVLVG